MFDIGGGEFILIAVLGLLIFGPRRLPEIGKQLGGFVAQLRNSMREFQGTLEREVALDDLKKTAGDLTAMREDVRGFVRDIAGVGRSTMDMGRGALDDARRAVEGTVPAGANVTVDPYTAELTATTEGDTVSAAPAGPEHPAGETAAPASPAGPAAEAAGHANPAPPAADGGSAAHTDHPTPQDPPRSPAG